MRPEHRRLLYAVTPDIADNGLLLGKIEEALAGGVGLLQYRNKTAPPKQRIEQARLLKRLCESFGVPLIVNDHLDVALEIDADGLHLGADDGDLSAARAKLGREKQLGASCYNRVELAENAVECGVSYVAFGAVFGSSTKPQAKQASLDLIRQARDRFSVPICAIGGITVENAAAVLDAGADWLAVIGGLFDGDDVFARARSFKRILDEHGSF